jgi:hypothetical protein
MIPTTEPKSCDRPIAAKPWQRMEAFLRLFHYGYFALRATCIN